MHKPFCANNIQRHGVIYLDACNYTYKDPNIQEFVSRKIVEITDLTEIGQQMQSAQIELAYQAVEYDNHQLFQSSVSK